MVAPPSATLLMNSSLIDSLMAKAAPENRPPPECSSDEEDVDMDGDVDDNTFPKEDQTVVLFIL